MIKAVVSRVVDFLGLGHAHARDEHAVAGSHWRSQSSHSSPKPITETDREDRHCSYLATHYRQQRSVLHRLHYIFHHGPFLSFLFVIIPTSPSATTTHEAASRAQTGRSEHHRHPARLDAAASSSQHHDCYHRRHSSRRRRRSDVFGTNDDTRPSKDVGMVIEEAGVEQSIYRSS
jgi:hypothetical protein